MDTNNMVFSNVSMEKTNNMVSSNVSMEKTNNMVFSNVNMEKTIHFNSIKTMIDARLCLNVLFP